MDDKKHTPGPWVATDVDVYSDAEVDDGNDIICVAGVRSRLGSRWEADARLIAAAPEMLEALRDCADYFHDFTEVDKEETRLAAICRDAIAKAKGETNG